MLSFHFKKTTDKFYKLHDNNVFIDWCIYNELIEDKNRNDQKKFSNPKNRSKSDSKKLWNKILIRYEVIKNEFDLDSYPSVNNILR